MVSGWPFDAAHKPRLRAGAAKEKIQTGNRAPEIAKCEAGAALGLTQRSFV
jgi:hypothetical protein